MFAKSIMKQNPPPKEINVLNPSPFKIQKRSSSSEIPNLFNDIVNNPS